MADSLLCQQVAEGEAFIGRSVVGHDPLDADAEALEPGQCAAGKSDSAVGFFVGEDFAVGQAAGIVDGDVEIFPAGAALVALAGAITGDAVADAVDAAEFLDVDVDEFAGFLALIAHDLWPGFERAEPSKTEPAQHGADGRARQTKLTRDLRTGAPLAAQALDRGQSVRVGAVRASGGRRTPVPQGKFAARPMPCQPTKRLSKGDPGGSGRISHPPPIGADALHQQGSTLWRQARILVDVHSGLPGVGCVCGNHSFTPTPRMNNPHSFYI